jgi:acyl-CoA thioesterase II
MNILYWVDNTRNGKSYCTRTVTAKQGGKAIFTCQLSFHKTENTIVQHQYPMPDLPKPQECWDYHQELQKLHDSAQTPSKYKEILRKHLDQPRPIQVRLIKRLNLENLINPKKEAKSYLWIKTPGKLNTTKSDPIHQCIAAFASDFGILGSSLKPHGLSSHSPLVKMMATIDHSVLYRLTKLGLVSCTF